MKEIKKILTLSLLVSAIIFGTTQINAATDPANAPNDWAFDESSVILHDLLMEHEYFSDIDSNEDGYISISEANESTHTHIFTKGITGCPTGSTLNGVEHFTRVVSLNYVNCGLTGEIPENISNLINLTIMDLGNNQLTGEIPENIGNLSENLRVLEISENQLTGKIPESIGNLTKLEGLSLYDNQLSGEIPASLGNLINIKNAFSLHTNQLTGEIPASLANLTKVRNLSLHTNQLSGKIPENLLENMNDLVMLQLHDNQLSGEIPGNIGNLPKLTTLYLHYNQFSGELPTSIGNLSNLEIFYIHFNELTGEIPESITNLEKMNKFSIGHNHIISITQPTYDYLSTQPFDTLYLYNQTYTTESTEVGTSGIDYTFTAIPAQEQFPNYGMVFEHKLTLPDGSEKVINPIVVDGKMTISGADMNQAGNYILVSEGSGGIVQGATYTHLFSVDPIEYLSAQADGVENQETTTKITITLSNDITDLSSDNISILSSTATNANNVTLSSTSVTVNKVTSLGNGAYDLSIDGDWSEGNIVDVKISTTNAAVSPDTKSTTLHKATDNTDGTDDTDATDDTDDMDDADEDTENPATPKTGNNNFVLLLVSLITSTLCCSMYLVNNRRI